MPSNAKKFILNNQSAQDSCAGYIMRLELDDPLQVEIRPFKKSRSLSQNATFHMWVGEISKYLIKRGKTDWNADFTKLNLKHTFLGYEDIEHIDMTTGEVTVKSQLRHTSDCDTGEMYHFMGLVEQWAANIGCLVTIPRFCEYRSLQALETA